MTETETALTNLVNNIFHQEFPAKYSATSTVGKRRLSAILCAEIGLQPSEFDRLTVARLMEFVHAAGRKKSEKEREQMRT